ncbi:hypothetical protein [Halomicrococcus sp. NG-SE-24]|uniref:hypothetical protein n=1 Tax=unclassified Halomicrococcus TaxID=2614448 RepID=UPI000DE0384D|nr:hypothetical protein DMJ13_10480 [halophilic archaeon]
MPEIVLEDGDTLTCDEVDLRTPGWLIAKYAGEGPERLKAIPRENVDVVDGVPPEFLLPSDED